MGVFGMFELVLRQHARTAMMPSLTGLRLRTLEILTSDNDEDDEQKTMKMKQNKTTTVHELKGRQLALHRMSRCRGIPKKDYSPFLLSTTIDCHREKRSWGIISTQCFLVVKWPRVYTSIKEIIIPLLPTRVHRGGAGCREAWMASGELYQTLGPLACY
jgi:hypothetical protein